MVGSIIVKVIGQGNTNQPLSLSSKEKGCEVGGLKKKGPRSCAMNVVRVIQCCEKYNKFGG